MIIHSMKPSVMILTGYGLNCEHELCHSFEICGAMIHLTHISELMNNPDLLDEYQILAIPGGFSFGDHLGSGVGLSVLLKHKTGDALRRFWERDTLTLGICNGCQVLIRIYHEFYDCKLDINDTGYYECRWIHAKASANCSPWLQSVDQLYMPIAHNEGKFVFQYDDPINIALRYISEEGDVLYGAFPDNPNGSEQDAAAVVSSDGKVLAMMPHPERAIYSYHRPDFHALQEKALRSGNALPEFADGLQMFRSGVSYFG